MAGVHCLGQREGGHDAVVKLLLLRKDVDTYS
jgi:hypothetical protein